MSARFPITLRTGAPADGVPPVAWRNIREKDGWLAWEPPGEQRAVQPELFLRELLDLDPSDHAAVIEFVQTHGQITSRYSNPSAIPEEAAAVVNRRPPRCQEFWNHVVDVEWWLRTARALTGHWLAVHAGDDPAEAWMAEGFMPGYDLDEEWAWMQFVEHLNYGLSEYRLRVERIWPSTGYVQGAPVTDLFSALCLQLAHHLAEDAVVRHCGHCGRPFVRQLGGAKQGQHRLEGVMYCTISCARSSAVRAYRLRKKEGSK